MDYHVSKVYCTYLVGIYIVMESLVRIWGYQHVPFLTLDCITVHYCAVFCDFYEELT